ncbi:MAG: prolyl-tRNA synthetase [Candidatus Doudnabacteria bacterium]|nr:prolyl-tRNA synthetase [Candidatus Doudnabacteria bacterium]
MKQSQLFTKVLKQAPKDEVATNARLLTRAGFIHKVMAGVYEYLPLGLMVLKKIEQIIREEMNAIGGQEVLMTTLQDKEVWGKTNRWDDKLVDNWFKTKLANGSDVGIANTHEEPLTFLLTHYVSSYKDLPIYIYQFQTKFRNELRAKSGILRGREFLMKDLYSFSKTQKEFREFYELCAGAYLKIFERVGLGDRTFRTAAAGGSFTTGLTDEFQTVTDSGEDVIYVDEKKKLAINKEVYTEENLKKLGLDKTKLKEKKAIEVGNIFPLGTKYSQALGLTVKDETGREQPVIMGSYGIGLGRLMGAVVEVSHDEQGMIWPKAIAPFDIHLINISKNQTPADKIYKALLETNTQVLYDEREVSAGSKFADSDLIGIPTRVLVSDKTLQSDSVETKQRGSDKTKLVKIKDLSESL